MAYSLPKLLKGERESLCFVKQSRRNPLIAARVVPLPHRERILMWSYAQTPKSDEFFSLRNQSQVFTSTCGWTSTGTSLWYVKVRCTIQYDTIRYNTIRIVRIVRIANCKVKVQSAKHGNMYRFITCHKGKNQDLRHKRFVTKTNQLYPKSCIVVPLMLN